MNLHSPLRIGLIAAALATAAFAGSAFAASAPVVLGLTNAGPDYLIMSAGGLADPMAAIKDFDGKALTYTGVDLIDSSKLIAMDNVTLDNTWLAIGKTLQAAKDMTPLVNPDEVGLGTSQGGYQVIQMLPTGVGDIAMIKNDSACAVPADSGGMLDPSAAGYKVETKTLGHVLAIGALGWTGSSAIPSAGCSNIIDSSATAQIG